MVEHMQDLCFRCSISSNYLMTLNKSLLKIELYVGAEVTFSIGQRRGFQNHQGAVSNAISPPPLEWQARIRQRETHQPGGPVPPPAWNAGATSCLRMFKLLQSGFPSSCKVLLQSFLTRALIINYLKLCRLPYCLPFCFPVLLFSPQ